ncbi:MAG TPA: Fur family transcriptional regulator [Longimicrobium sp.]|jgi:Fur family ferric uptake transcriptional regulator
MCPTPPEVFELLARRGHRLTRPRRAVVEALAAAGGPVSAQALHSLPGLAHVDLVTVYRTLHWLAELGLARTAPGAGLAELYELAAHDDHSHHLLCDGCGLVLTVAICGLDEAVAERIAREHGFIVSHHRLTFHGSCAGCAAQGNGSAPSSIAS